jgi:hypothetical protein
MYANLAYPFIVAAGTTQHRLMEVSGQVPCNSYPTLSMVDRAVLFVRAGASASQVQIGLSGGSVTSPAFTVPAYSTVTVYYEDTGPVYVCNLQNYLGVVVTAGSGGAITVEPGSSFTYTATPTENALY